MVKYLGLVAVIALGAVVARADAVAQTSGDLAAGRDLATRVCATCHQLPGRPAPRGNAPRFAAIANARGVTETSLHVFLSSPHPTMPNLILSQPQQDDVIAYILSLRKQP
jgi:cytochrome c